MALPVSPEFRNYIHGEIRLPLDPTRKVWRTPARGSDSAKGLDPSIAGELDIRFRRYGRLPPLLPMPPMHLGDWTVRPWQQLLSSQVGMVYNPNTRNSAVRYPAFTIVHFPTAACFPHNNQFEPQLFTSRLPTAQHTQQHRVGSTASCRLSGVKQTEP